MPSNGWPIMSPWNSWRTHLPPRTSLNVALPLLTIGGASGAMYIDECTSQLPTARLSAACSGPVFDISSIAACILAGSGAASPAAARDVDMAQRMRRTYERIGSPGALDAEPANCP